MKKILLTCSVLFSAALLFGQSADRWQQAAKYKMDIDFDVKSHQFKGKQSLEYTNNSTDVLDKVFYHLYFNAFQPGSMMDVRSRTIKDPDRRVKDRISKLKPEEYGYQKVNSLTMNGEAVKFEVVGTILEVQLKTPIQPNSTVKFEMDFEAQVPLQVRRSGRDSSEGIDYSMTQWYPKMCEYDYQGWHSNPYVGREFHGIWGDFDVKISIDGKYMLGASGVLQNADEIGMGYSDEKAAAKERHTWHFLAENVHDFAWAADPDYTHTKLQIEDGPMLHFIFQKNEKTADNWAKLPAAMAKSYEYMKKTFGEYPYAQYTFIQGGDGGMEYPMITLITGERGLGSLVGVSIHEWMHSWYQMMLGTNEALYAWMDEGFTSYGSAQVMNNLKANKLIPGEVSADPNIGQVRGYLNLAKSGYEEPLTTHADHFVTNFAYGNAAYTKGAAFLHVLQYIIGKEDFDKGLMRYYDEWRFKHPNPNDCIRSFEKESGLELDWYKEYFVNTTHTPDYGVKSVEKNSRRSTKITLEKIGVMPMPLDVVVTEKDGKKTVYNIPLRIMRGAKAQENKDMDYKVIEDWPWTNPSYEFTIDCPLKKIVKVEIDASNRMPDADRTNNVYEQEKK